MQFSSLLQLASLALLAATVQAGYNCKCQDDRGQYDILTQDCCLQNVGKYRGDLNHQVRHRITLEILYPSELTTLVVAPRYSLHGELYPLTDPHSAQTLSELLTLVNLLIAARATVLEVHTAGNRCGIVGL